MDEIESIKQQAMRVMWNARTKGLVSPAPTWEQVNCLLARIETLEQSRQPGCQVT